MAVKQYDWVFAVVLSVSLRNTSGNLKNEDSGKSDSFCDFYSFLWNEGYERHLIFVKGLSALKKVGKLWHRGKEQH